MELFTVLSLLGKTLAAIYRPVIFGLKRDLRFLSTRCASRRVHFSVCRSTVICPSAAIAVFTGYPAIFAASRFVGKALFCIKILFASGEYKAASAVFANECLVFVHL
jgi:hypothetical protein